MWVTSIIFPKHIPSYSELLLPAAEVWGGGLMRGLFVPAPEEQVCPGLLLNSTHSHALNNPNQPREHAAAACNLALRASLCLWMSRSLHAVAGMFLWVSCKALGKGPYLASSPFVVLPFLYSCPWDTGSSFPSRNRCVLWGRYWEQPPGCGNVTLVKEIRWAPAGICST